MNAPSIDPGKLIQEIVTHRPALLDFSPIPVAIASLSRQKFVYANRAMADYLQISLEQICTLGSESLYANPTDKIKVESMLREKGALYNQEIQFIKPGGSRSWVLLSLQMLEFKGEPSVFGSIIDITDRKRAEETLLDSENRFRALIEGMNVGMVLHKPDTTIILYNRQALEFLGLTSDQLLGVTSFDPRWNVIHEDGSPFPPQAHPVSQAITTGEAIQNVVMGVYRPATESRVWLMVNASPIKTEDGRLKEVVVTFSDITPLREVQEQQQLTETRLRETVGMLNNLFNSSRQVHVFIDTNYQVLWFNRVAQETTYSLMRKELRVGTNVTSYIPASEVQDFMKQYQAALAGQVVQYERQVSIPMQPSIYYEVGYVPIYDQDGTIIGVSYSANNITERKQMEQQKLELAIQHEKLDLLERIVRDTSHDLRTPITLQGTSIYLLNKFSQQLAEQLEGIPTKEKMQQTVASVIQHTGNIERANKRLVELIESLFDMAQIDTHAHFYLKEQEVNQIAHFVWEGKQESAQYHQLDLQLDLGQNLPNVMVDEPAITRALQKLVENALQYTPSGGQVIIRTRIYMDKVVLEVADTGTGINAEDIPHLFESFYRTDKARQTKTGGIGLGLTIVQKIVEAHHGTVEVESTPGVGSRFRILLPVQESL